VLWPKLEKFLAGYPDIKVEVIVENGLTDIVAERFDAGTRVGEQAFERYVACCDSDSSVGFRCTIRQKDAS
jgi:DNA-binding transcriptional LysR family regulator